MHLLSVGKPYHAGQTHFPEGADYNYWSGEQGFFAYPEHELRIFLADPMAKEVAAVESGPVEFGMFAEPEGLFVVARFGRALSFNCSYQWHRVEEAERVAPPPMEETSPALRALLSIMLVDASTGIVQALRAVSYSPEFTRAIHRAIAGQAAAPYDGPAHDRWADGMLRYTTAELWDRCTIRCRGGD
jgi:hypothetical protein